MFAGNWLREFTGYDGIIQLLISSENTTLGLHASWGVVTSSKSQINVLTLFNMFKIAITSVHIHSLRIRDNNTINS